MAVNGGGGEGGEGEGEGGEGEGENPSGHISRNFNQPLMETHLDVTCVLFHSSNFENFLS